MPKVKISEYSATANSNTDVASINIDEGCAPSGINNAIRAVMGHLKDFQQGTNGDPFNGPVNGTVGATTPSTGAFTTLSATGNVTLGDASTDTLNVGNGGLIKDSSGNLGLGVTPSAWISSWKVLEQAGVSLASSSTIGIVGQNWWINSSGSDRYLTTAAASIYKQTAGSHSWGTAPSGTAGTAITFTQVLAVEKAKSLALEGATSQTGTGITFPATQSASTDANTLDDYEEGTFNPDIAGTSAAGTATYATDGRVGRYTKIGNRCYFNIWLNWTNLTGATGSSMAVKNLPFTAKAISGAYNNVAVYMDASLTLGGAGVIQGYLPTADTYIYLSYYTSGGSNAVGLTIDTSAALMLTGSYEVN